MSAGAAATIGREDVVAAAERIGPYIRRTPVLELDGSDLGLDNRLTLKLDLLQRTGSFKVRGAFNALLDPDLGEASVVAASGGNFGLAVAFAARELGRPAAIFVTESTAPAKLAGIRACGVDVVIAGPIYADAQAMAEEHAANSGARLLHAYDQPAVAAGQGTCGLELVAQDPGLDTVLVAVGGGGLLAGVAAALDGSAKIVAVETTGTPTLARALSAGEPVDVELSGLAVDSLGATRIGELGFAGAKAHVGEVVLVEDDEVRDAQRRLWASARLSAEPGGAAALAALTSGAYEPQPGERTAAIVCGGNLSSPRTE